jgi:hypothetical protein
MVVIAVALALGTNAVAAKDRIFAGSLEPAGSGTVSLEFKQVEGVTWRFYEYEFKRVPLNCDGGQKTRMTFGGSESVRNDQLGREEFGFTSGQQDPDGQLNYEWTIDGRVASPRKAKGFVRAHGPEVPLEDGGTASCDSGVIRFTLRTKS